MALTCSATARIGSQKVRNGCWNSPFGRRTGKVEQWVAAGRGRKATCKMEKVAAMAGATLHSTPEGVNYWSCRTIANSQVLLSARNSPLREAHPQRPRKRSVAPRYRRASHQHQRPRRPGLPKPHSRPPPPCARSRLLPPFLPPNVLRQMNAKLQFGNPYAQPTALHSGHRRHTRREIVRGSERLRHA
jgi:hypothetical protein